MNTLVIQRALGYLGLIPFIVPTICMVLSVPLLHWEPARFFIAYSAVILAFLSGTLWGRSLGDDHKAKAQTLLISSNLLALLAWLCLLLAGQQLALVLLMLGYLAVLQVELKCCAGSGGYRGLRLQLSALVLLLHGGLLITVMLP